MKALILVIALFCAACGRAETATVSSSTTSSNVSTDSNISTNTSTNINSGTGTSSSTSINSNSSSCSQNVNGRECRITCVAPKSAVCVKAPAGGPSCTCK